MDTGSRNESLILIAVLALTVWIVIKWFLLVVGFSDGVTLFAIVLSASVGYLYRPKDWTRQLGGDARYIGLMAGLAFLTVARVFFAGHTLPAHDPIAVPVLANIIAKGQTPFEVFEIGTSAATYPPGQPILLSAIREFLTSVDQLLALKWLVIAAVSLIPLSWAWFHKRLFGSESYVTLVVCYYSAFFCIERTIGFAIPFAGKNALLFGILLTPAVSILMIHLARGRFSWPLGGIALFGLVLINYSLLHLMAAVVGCAAVALFVSRQINFRVLSRLCGMGIICLGLFITLLAPVFADPRAAPMTFLPSNFGSFLDFWWAYGSGLVIYMDTDFGIPPSPYRGMVLLFCYLIILFFWKIRTHGQLLTAASVYFAAFVILFLMGLSILPAGISFDFFRWIAWPLQASLIACALQAIILFARSISRTLFITVTFAIVALSGGVLLNDSKIYAAVNASQAISRQDLRYLAEVLKTESPCYIIGESVSNRISLITVQPSRLLDYAEAVTDCRYLNGSWVHFGIKGGRDILEMPSREVLDDIDGEIFLIATPDKMTKYASITKTNWSMVGVISGRNVWAMSR